MEFLGAVDNTWEITMIDSQTHSKIRVSTDGTAGPYIMVLADQLSLLRGALDEHKIRYWVDADTISLDGKPAIAIINLGHSGDAAQVQKILDDAT